MRLPIILFCAAATMVATPGYAKPDHAGHGKVKGKEIHQGHNGTYAVARQDDRVLISLDDDRHALVRSHLQPYYVKHCPPGLAKKHNGCLPPGQAKKLYTIGQPLRADYWPVPQEVMSYLPAAPVGTRYVWVDRDVLLISEATKKVLDATVILSGL